MSFARKLALAAMLATAGIAQAALVTVAADNFDTAANGSLTGQAGGSGWAGAWTGSGSVAVAGQALSFTGNNDSAATRTLASAISSNQVVVQFDVQFSAGVIDNNDFLGLWLGNIFGPNAGVKGNCDGAANCNGADLFVRTSGTTGSFTTPMTVGTTYHLFALLEKAAGSAVYNRYSLWVDPTGAEMAGLTGADAVFNGSSGISAFSTIGFRTANLDGGDVIRVDNLTISTVPEPASAALAALALLGVLATRRRRAA